MAVVIAFSLIFFSLTLGIATHSARTRAPEQQPPTVRQFLTGDVSIQTGALSGWDALVQILMLPVTLALGAMVIGFIFILGL
jgi:hypothetical protein